MDDREPLVLPKQFAKPMREFLTNGCTGNLKLNVKDGRILGEAATADRPRQRSTACATCGH